MPPPKNATAPSRSPRFWSMCFLRPTRSMRKATNPPPRILLDNGAEQISQNTQPAAGGARAIARVIGLPTGDSAHSDAPFRCSKKSLAIRKDQRPVDKQARRARPGQFVAGSRWMPVDWYRPSKISRKRWILLQADDAPRSADTADLLAQYGHFFCRREKRSWNAPHECSYEHWRSIAVCRIKHCRSPDS